MKTSKIIMFTSLAVCNFLFFQNCVGKSFEPSETEVPTTKGTESDSTGQPYDGKIYVFAGTGCSDGTFVQSRIIIENSMSATVVRENCQDANRLLKADEFSFHPTDPNQIVYQNLTFSKEQPAVVIPVLTSWYYQLTGTLRSPSATLYDLDLFETSAAQIQSLKQSGRIVICNFSSGTFEDWRPDASSFSAADLGNNVSGSGAEKWIDTRSASVRSIMMSRLDLAKNKGCDGVDLDSADGYQNGSGFPLTSQTQIEFNRYLAFAAHDRKLIVALKNTADLVAHLVDTYDFAITEDCFRYNECSKYQPFTALGKPVLSAEFTPYSSVQCSSARSSSLSLAFFNQALDGTSYQACP